MNCTLVHFFTYPLYGIEGWGNQWCARGGLPVVPPHAVRWWLLDIEFAATNTWPPSTREFGSHIETI